MESLLKTARFVFLALLAGAFLAVGSQGIIPVQDAEAGMDNGAVESAAAPETLARNDDESGFNLR